MICEMDLCQARRRPQRILCVLSRARTKLVTNPAAKIVLFLSDNSISSSSLRVRICVSSGIAGADALGSPPERQNNPGTFALGVPCYGFRCAGSGGTRTCPLSHSSLSHMQLLACYASKEKGCEIDKPKNLAKSVTMK